MAVAHQRPAPPGYGKLPLITVAFVMGLTTLASNAPSPLYVVYQQRYHFSALVLTAVFAAYAVGVMVALVGVGRLSDAIGRRKVLGPGLVLLGCSAALFMAARGTGWLLAARGVQGVATGAITSAATAALVELEPNGDRQRASYLNTVVFLMGAATGPLAFGVCAQYLPWPTVLPFAAEAALVAVAVVGVSRLPETAPARAEVGWRFQRPSVPRAVLAPFVLAVLALAVCWGVGALFAALSASIDEDLLHIRNHALVGGLLFCFYGVGGLSQRLLRRRTARWAVMAGLATVAAGMSLLYLGLLAASVPAALGGGLLVGAGSGCGFMGSLALANAVAPPQRRAELISAWNMVGYFALSAPVVGVGLLAGVIGLRNATGIFAAAVVAMAVATIAAVRAAPHQPLARLSAAQLTELGLEAPVVASGTV
ncbi:MAG TPA: MFS transporter [Acidimicrobiales bacterium]|nr:MFS transporter [Acidimicrobiales bacterium]